MFAQRCLNGFGGRRTGDDQFRDLPTEDAFAPPDAAKTGSTGGIVEGGVALWATDSAGSVTFFDGAKAGPPLPPGASCPATGSGGGFDG